MKRKDKLQEICRGYLERLKHVCVKHGLNEWVNDIMEQNKRGECVATEQEVEMLSRMVNDERISRKEIPTLLGKSYRQCNDDDDFDKIKKLKRVGIYSKVSALLYYER